LLSGGLVFTGCCDFAGFLVFSKPRKRAKRSMTVKVKGCVFMVGHAAGQVGGIPQNSHRNHPAIRPHTVMLLFVKFGEAK
jgi:hypothetical protein